MNRDRFWIIEYSLCTGWGCISPYDPQGDSQKNKIDLGDEESKGRVFKLGLFCVEFLATSKL